MSRATQQFFKKKNVTFSLLKFPFSVLITETFCQNTAPFEVMTSTIYCLKI